MGDALPIAVGSVSTVHCMHSLLANGEGPVMWRDFFYLRDLR
jgi:hypothetical protein